MNTLTPIVFRAVPDIKEPLPLSIGLSGGSGTGKTYTALSLGRGIARGMTGRDDARIGVVDTENGRALHYAQQFPEMLHYDMRAVDANGNMVGFPPERWIQVIDAAEAAGIDALIIDSFSHEWEGVNGVLDLQAQALNRLTGGDESKKKKLGQLAWAEIKPRHRRLVDRIVRAKVPVIICTRAKPVMQEKSAATDWKEVNARATKTRRRDVPWDSASDGDLMFEMTAMIILDPTAKGHPIHQIKVTDQHKNLFDQRRPMDVETGAKLAEWAKGDDEGIRQKAALDLARAEARKGAGPFATWWNSTEAKPLRGWVRPILDELADIAKQADIDAAAADSDDPLAGRGGQTIASPARTVDDDDEGPSPADTTGPVTRRLTPEEIDAQDAELDRRDREGR